MPEHYFSKKTKIPLMLGLVSATIRKQRFEFYSSPPVFSWRQIDKGTIALANGMQLEDAKTLLDMGCGYGVIGVVAAFFFPELKVTMIDPSERAVYLAKKNVEKYSLEKRAEVLKGSLYEPFETKDNESGKIICRKFDVIVSNPPYSAGKNVVNQIIRDSVNHLNNGGSLQIVGRHSKGGRMYKEEMLKYFKTVEETGRASGYRVYIGRN